MTVPADNENQIRSVEPARAFTLGRIVALVLISLTALGLVHLHFSTGSDSLSVPSGAHAGQLTLHECNYATEDGSYRADCGTLVVPENRHDADSRLIAIPVTRIRARSAEPDVPIFRLQGGPGITNMDFPAASRFAERHDVVLVGYRGVDGSSRLDCPEVASARAHAREFLTQQSYGADAAAFEECASRLQREGVDLAGYTLPQRVDDLDAARHGLGYQRIDLLSESAGTRTAMIYAWRYPKRIHRSVMISGNPPGRFLWDAKTTGEQIRRYAALCAKDASCRGRTPDLAASIQAAYERIPKRFWFLPIKTGNVKAAGFFGLFNATSVGDPVIPGPKTIDTLLAARGGDGSGAWFLSLLAQLAFPTAQVWGDAAAIARTDAAYARRYFANRADRGSAVSSAGNDLVWAGGRLLDAWPVSPDENEYARVQESQVETLLIGGSLDFAAPPQNATRELLPHLPNGQQVVLPNLGHADDFWAYEPAAGSRLVNTFLDSGRVDASRYSRNRIDFTPSGSHGMIARIILAVALGFAALTLLSLLWMALRLRRRGGYGRKTSVLLRCAYVPLLGLGGWFIGVLVVLATLPTVPLDDERLTTLAVGFPIGLGIYFAWTNRDWSTTTKRTGLAAATAGALVGAWLGATAIEGIYAVMTAVVGAALGANLILLSLDIAWDRQARDRLTPTRPKDTLHARPSTR